MNPSDPSLTAFAAPQESNSNSNSGIALVIGSGGGIGGALVEQLRQQRGAASVLALGRSSSPPVDYTQPDSIEAAAQWVQGVCQQQGAEVRLLIVATGFLHGTGAGQPERSLAQLDAAYLAHVFLVNTIGPALVMKHFLPLLPKSGPCVAAFLSARVGSIGDNTLGGWYGYRASKAALNQLVKTASIEVARRNRQAVCVALHPGTVATPLSQPFGKSGLQVRPAAEAATDLLQVVGGLTALDNGAFFDHKGLKIVW